MIDFKKALQVFKNYLKDYDLEDGNIMLKVKHTYEVVNKSEYIAKGLGLDEENTELAKLIALLHDIGRFEQVKQTNDFLDDQGFDHADFGVEVLFDKNMIRDFVDDSKYDDIIRKAIYNHNKYEIEDGVTEQELLHCKIIRDADKLDNFRVKEVERFENIFPSLYNAETMSYEVVSDKVYEACMNCQCVKIEDRENQLDFWVSYIAFLFGLYFDVSRRFVRERGYVDILVDRITYKNEETRVRMEEIRKCAKEFLERCS